MSIYKEYNKTKIMFMAAVMLLIIGYSFLRSEKVFADDTFRYTFEADFITDDVNKSISGNIIYLNKNVTVKVPCDAMRENELAGICEEMDQIKLIRPELILDYYRDEYIGISIWDGEKFSEYDEIGESGITLYHSDGCEYERQVFILKRVVSYKIVSLDSSLFHDDYTGEDVEEGKTHLSLEEPEVIKFIDIVYTTPVYQVVFDTKAPEIMVESEKDTTGKIATGMVATIKANDKCGIKKASFYRNEKLVEEVNLEGEKRIISYEYDIALIKENSGKDTVRAVVCDLSGNETEIKFEYEVDNTAPVIAYSGVNNGEIYRDSVKLNVSVDDNAKKTIVQYRCELCDENGNGTVIESSTNEYEGLAEFSREYNTEGIYDVTILAYDENGNYSEVVRLCFGLDTKAPTVDLSGVSYGGVYNLPVSVCAVVKELFYEGASAQLEGNIYENSSSKKADISPYIIKSRINKNIYTFSNEGKYHIKLKAKDMSGHESERECEFMLDRTAPNITIDIDGFTAEDLSENSCVLSNRPDINIKIADKLTECVTNAKLFQKAKDGSYKLVDSEDVVSVGMTAEFNVKIPSEGEFLLDVISRDEAGNIADKSVVFTVDENPPVIGYISDFNQKYLKNFYLPDKFKDYIVDSTNVRYRAYLNSKEVNACDLKKDGKYLLQIVAVDAAGNRSEEMSAFIIDNTAPKIIVNGLNQEGKVTKDGIIKMTLFDKEDFFKSATVNGRNVEIKADGKEIDIMAEEYGDYDISVVASDYAGNEITQVVNASCAMASNPFSVKINKEDIKTLTKNDEEIHESFFEKIKGVKFAVFCGVFFIMATVFLGLSLFDMRRL